MNCRPNPSELLIAAACLLAAVLPFLTSNVLLISVTHQILIGTIATFGVFIMLRMDLLNFSIPAFMAIGAYCAAIAAVNGLTDAVFLIAISFVIPAMVAAVLGALVLRLRGVFFVLVTFIFSEIVQLAIFELPELTGGSQGINGVPSATLLGTAIASNRQVYLFAAVLMSLSALISAVTVRRFGPHFAAIHENEVLAKSLGLAVWRYKAAGFVISAGIAGLAGLALATMLLTAHPSSFTALSAVNYLTYAIVGGTTSILGPVLGSSLLIWASNLFSSKGEFSQGLFGLLLILSVFVAKRGIVGTVMDLIARRSATSKQRIASRAHNAADGAKPA
jgi:branched-chain amino acid transport system permease protein